MYKSEYVHKAQRLSYLVAILLILVFSCSLPSWPWADRPTIEPTAFGSGAMLVRQGAFVYRIGGEDKNRAPIDDVLVAQVDALGNLGEWRVTASLPQGRKHGLAVAAGNYLYVLGGIGPSGASSTIYFTYINADGMIGFGAGVTWESNLRNLPLPLAATSGFYYDGRIVLIGGETLQNGNSTLYNGIVHARVYADGQVGQWYESPEKLPQACSGAAAAILENRLYVASDGSVTSWAVEPYFKLSDKRNEPMPPIGAHSALIIPDGEGLLLLGGYVSQKPITAAYRFEQGKWSLVEHGLELKAEGPTWAVSGGKLFYINPDFDSEASVVLSASLGLSPSAPSIHPGSGLIPSSATLRVSHEPSLEVRYRTNGYEVQSNDPVWTNRTITNASHFDLRAFAPERAGNPASGQIALDVNTRDASGMLHISDHYEAVDTPIGPATLTQYTLLSSSTWCDFSVATRTKYAIALGDINAIQTLYDTPSINYTGSIKATIYESDLYTTAIDVNGDPLIDIETGGALRNFVVGPGIYYVHIVETNGASGNTFGAALLRLE